jgi:ribokinase
MGRRLLARGARPVILNMGAQGALLVNPTGEHFWPAFAVTAVDTTGAGDVFNGAFAVALLEGRSPEEAGRFASAAAAVSVTRRAAQPSMPTRAEVDALLAAHKP